MRKTDSHTDARGQPDCLMSPVPVGGEGTRKPMNSQEKPTMCRHIALFRTPLPHCGVGRSWFIFGHCSSADFSDHIVIGRKCFS